MTTHAPVITDSIKAELETWRDTFVKHWEKQPSGFFMSPAGRGHEEAYSLNIGDLINPIHTEWFQQLVREAGIADLNAIERHLSKELTDYMLYLSYRRFFQWQLITAARKAHDEKRPYSKHIPFWFRSQMFNIGPKWECEAQIFDPG